MRLKLVARVSGRAVRRLAPRISDTEIPYTDINGYARSANVHDILELEGFLGLGRLERYITQTIDPGDWVVDVGANVGLISAQLCRLVGPNGRVWAIEPIPRNLRRLRELSETNRLGQLRIFEGGLSNKTGRASIRLPVDRQSGWASFTKSWDMQGSLDTSVWKLDDLVAGEPGRIAFMKIDVEGFEPQVLEGAARTLITMRPRVLCEFNDILLRDAGTSASQLLKLFADFGYQPSPECNKVANDLEGKVTDLLLDPVGTITYKPAAAPVGAGLQDT